MKKFFAILLSVSLCVFILASCGGNTDTVPSTEYKQQETAAPSSSGLQPEKSTNAETTTNSQEETTPSEQTTAPVEKDWPVSEEDVKNYVNMAYGKYAIYTFKEMNVTSPSQYGKVFPRKDSNGSYKAPGFIEKYLYNSGKLVSLDDSTSYENILTPAEAQYISATSTSKVYSAVSVSQINQAVGEIFGSGRFYFSGSIESGYTQSGYYLIPSSSADDGAAELDHYTIESVVFDNENNVVNANVTEKWTDYSNNGATVIKKTMLSLRINGTNVFLKEIFY